MRLNRAYQREILSRLAEDYPDIDDKNKAWFENEFEQNGRTYACNVSYLMEHGLLGSGVTVRNDISGAPASISLSFPSTTVKGIDFIAEDGGLSAILSVQTVKLHEETIRDLLSIAVQQSQVPEEEKKQFEALVKELPAEGLKHLLTKLIDLGLSNAPRLSDLVGIIQNIGS